MNKTDIINKEFDYDWINNNTVHHNYLIKSVENIIKIENTSNIELLDIGCGNGYLTQKFQNFLNTLLELIYQGQELKSTKIKK